MSTLALVLAAPAVSEGGFGSLPFIVIGLWILMLAIFVRF